MAVAVCVLVPELDAVLIPVADTVLVLDAVAVVVAVDVSAEVADDEPVDVRVDVSVELSVDVDVDVALYLPRLRLEQQPVRIAVEQLGQLERTQHEQRLTCGQGYRRRGRGLDGGGGAHTLGGSRHMQWDISGVGLCAK